MSIMRRTSHLLPYLALGIAMFCAWMHPAILDPRNVGWLLDGSDRGLSSLALIAYLRGGTWPGLHDPLLMFPDGLPLALTDSNPLLGLLLKPFGLPTGWQVTGLWLLACVLLQVGFARALVARYIADPLAAFLGTALLAISPALIARYGHVNLCAHWLILWALWVFIDPDRARRPGWWAAVVGVAMLVHPYLAVMTAAIWASAVLRQLTLEPQSWRRTAVGATAVAVLLAGIAWWLGFVGLGTLPTGSYGQFGMALDALWNPGNADYSALLPGLTTTAAQGFEGFNYLGAGLLLLLVVAVTAVVVRRDRLADLPLVWLIPAFLLLTLVAIGPHLVWRGQIVLALPVPTAVRDALDPVRAGGRLFWPIGYAIALAAIVVAGRLPRGTLILGAALALQLFDLMPMVSAVRATSARGVDHLFVRTRDSAWQAMVERASAIEFVPATPYLAEDVRDELTWRAITAPRPVPLRYFYASREPAAIRNRLDADAAAFRAGRIDPARLYVILDNRVPLSVMNRIQLIDGIAVIPPASPSSPR
ncbi:MAG: hypothetical protein JWO16_1558 [Sphingomonas bacterium]|nr:hypothetical protein [Sphingomonas bacterium]